MATYTVYVPSGIGDTRQRADRTVFIREGFSVAAFLFGPLYLLGRRLWLAAAGWILVAVLFAVVAHGLGLPPVSGGALFVLMALLTGFEAGVLRQAALRRRGYFLAAVLTKASLEEAESAFFNGEGLPDARHPAPGAGRLEGHPGGRVPEVIGLFPQSGEA